MRLSNIPVPAAAGGRLPLRLVPTLAALALLLPVHAAWAQSGAAARPAAGAKPAAKPAPRPAAARPAAAKPAAAAAAAAPLEVVSPGQLDVAARVLTGTADCEFNQKVDVLPIEGQAGHFMVRYQGKRYRMVPRETATGAVRLEDPLEGVVWLQIPAKSMLMNARRGQRMIDACMHAEQRAAVAAVQAAAQHGSIGIAPGSAAAASAPAAASGTPPGAGPATVPPAGTPPAGTPPAGTPPGSAPAEAPAAAAPGVTAATPAAPAASR